MSDEDKKPKEGEKPESKPETDLLPGSDATTPQADATTPAKAKGEEWDPERAMSTIKALRDEEKKWKKDQKELEALKAEKQKREEAEMTELDKANKRIAELEAQNKQAQFSLWRNEAAAKANLPSIFADRVQGETLEEMKEDALKLAEALPKQDKKIPSLKSTNPANGERKETDAEKRARLFGPQGQNYFGDASAIIKEGGGVMDFSVESEAE